MTGAGAAQGNSDAQDNGGVSLLLVEKKRWALDGQIHCLAVTKDIHTGMPILLVAQPGLKFIMVDHTGNMSEPVTQVQRNPKAAVNVAGPDTPTRSVGTGDVATDIICGTHYVNGEKKDIIGLMSMDGAFALRDLENNTVKVHDLDSTHKIFGFSKLNFGNNYMEQQTQDSRRAESVYGRSSNRRADENNTCDDDDVDDIDSNAGDTFAETLTLGHGDCSDGEEDSRYSRPNGRRSARELASSMLVSEPYGSRFQKDDMFVGCSWSGITFFIDQDFNTAKYDFDARVCAFGAGRNEPCLFYVDFEDNIYVYYNLYIQTEPSVQFQDVVKADAALVRASQKICLENAADKDHERPEDSPGFAEAAQPNRENASSTNVPDYRLPTSEWLERDMKNFIHDSLYNVDRYEDEFQQLKRLADIERAKRAAFLEAEANKERAQQGAELKDVAESAVALAGTAAVTAKASLAYMDPRLRRPPHVLTVDIAAGLDLDSGPKMTRSHSRGKAAQRGQFRGHGITTSQYALARQGMANQGGDDDNDDQLSSLSPVSPILLPSPKPRKASRETRRSSLLIKDVLSHYEGKTTPPLKSPTSPSASSSLMSKDLKSGSSQTATGPSTALKRFSIMEVSNGGRISRSSSTSSGSSGSNSSNSQSTITQGHPLTKGKGLETRIGKALRANRPAGVSRNRPLGVMGRKSGARSRLSLQQHRDDTEDGDDEALSEDGTGETDGDNLAEFDRPSRKSAGEYDFQQNQDFEAELAAEDFYNGARGNAGNEGEEGAHGVYTPSTISPIPSPGRFYGSQQGSTAEPSASLDGTAYMFSRGLLSPTTRSAPSGATAATSTAGAIGKTSRQSDQDYYGPSSLSSFRGHARQRSGHGLLDTGLGHLQTREIAVSSGIGSGPNSAGHSSVQDGRRSRAESVLSTGSDIGGMVVPDITLLASSFPNQPSVPFSMSDPLLEEETSIKEYDESDDDVANAARDDHGNPDNAGLAESKERSDVLRSGVRRPPQRSATLGSQDGASHGTGSGSDTATGKSIGQRSGQSGGEERAAAVKSGDVKLLPAPLPRSNQHHQRHQLEQQGSSGSVTGSNGSKDPGHSTSTQVSFSSSACPNSAIGGGVETRDGMHEGGEGFGRGRSGKASSTTSSTAVSDFGSGPSSPLTSNVTVTNAILSNPSTNSYKGFSVLSFPLASPSASTASAQQHQYFAPSHYHQYALPPHPHSGASAHSSSRGIDRVSAHDDDKMSIRSRASTYRSIEDNNDISSVLAAATSSLMGSGSGGSGSEHGLYRISPASTSSSHLVSDSLVRRLEELQQQDRDLERQRQKEREKDKDRDREKEKEKDRSRSGQSSRPPALSRANSGASIRSSVSHHRTPIPHPPTSHVSATGSNYGSGLASGPVSGSGSVSGSAFGSTPGSGPASGPGRHTAGIVRINTILGNERRSDQA
ncbi:integrin alpha FG-GAP repeat-containing protein 2 [Dissophora ornata]|nr:integrin alpha FG-GAP repeat-containing protein 2 [Dissophora ornata]